MCGIFSSLGHYSVDDVRPHFQLIQHRGPDASHIEVVDQLQNKNLIFGFHRLAIIDPTEHSMQPLTLNDLVLICNGEIFNYKVLVAQYGFAMKTKSDCEVILYLYEYFGRNEAALAKLLNEMRGEFAFVLYDKTAKTLMAARDPFGIRPLFYSYSGKELVLASEMKALLFRDMITPFLPGSYIFREHSANHNTTKFIKYYFVADSTVDSATDNKKKRPPTLDFLFTPDANTAKTVQIVHKNIRNLLKQSVGFRLMSDRPVGCFLSGGLDSSLVASLASQYIGELHCFSIGLAGGLDIAASKKVVAFLQAQGRNIKHHIVHFTVEEGFKALEAVIRCLETRCVTTIRAGVVNYLLAQYVATTNVKVLYSGSGADEVFNGYQYGKLISNDKILERDSKRLLEELYLYDNLRDDRTAANFGLEVRMPFLCRDLVDYVFSIHGDYRLSNIYMEKTLLRDAFKFEDVLPDEILYRRKEAWSDAVSSKEVSWYKTLVKKHIAPRVSDSDLRDAVTAYPYDTPKTKESYFYRKVFEGLFPGRAAVIPKIWLPPAKIVGQEVLDPSATVLNCYEQ